MNSTTSCSSGCRKVTETETRKQNPRPLRTRFYEHGLRGLFQSVGFLRQGARGMNERRGVDKAGQAGGGASRTARGGNLRRARRSPMRWATPLRGHGWWSSTPTCPGAAARLSAAAIPADDPVQSTDIGLAIGQDIARTPGPTAATATAARANARPPARAPVSASTRRKGRPSRPSPAPQPGATGARAPARGSGRPPRRARQTPPPRRTPHRAPGAGW